MRQLLATVLALILVASCATGPRYVLDNSSERLASPDAQRALQARIAKAAPIPGKLDTSPQLLHSALPGWPREVLEKKNAGRVTLDALVDESGAVAAITVVESPHMALSKAAVDAVKQWRFAPMTADGRPTKFRFIVDFDFE